MVPARGKKRRSVKENKSQTRGVLRLSSGFSLGYTAESNTPSKPAGGVADHRRRNKAITGQRHALAAIRLGLLHDVEKNPGLSNTWKCTKCRKGITRKTWSVKCNGCSEWIHWDCIKLGEDGRWSPSFLGECCQPIQEEPAETSGKLLRRQTQRRRRRGRRKILREEKWSNTAKTLDKHKFTKIWTWNVRKARASFPRRGRFCEILREIAKSEVELVLFSEMNEETPGIKWIKSKELYGVLVHGKCSGVFLRDLWAVNWLDQGCQRECGKRSTSVCVDGTKLIALYQPLWNSDPEVFKEYREELSSQLQTRKARHILVIGGDFNATVGDIQVREADEAAGQFGLGKTNRAGRDLIDWCHEHQLCWVNSFFRHNNRGTWKNPAYHAWHELDGFVMKQSQRSRVARGIRTNNTRCKLSDHEPKSMSCNLQWRLKAVINWDKLREQGPKTEYEKGVDEGLSAVQGEVDWKALTNVVTATARKVCGIRQKAGLSPWIDEHLNEMEEHKRRISELTRRIEASSGTGRLSQWKEERRRTRRQIKKDKKRWKESWWLRIVQEAKSAEGAGDTRKLYQTLRRIGVKDTQTIEDEFFSPEEYRAHFMAVSKHRYEREPEDIEATALKQKRGKMQSR